LVAGVVAGAAVGVGGITRAAAAYMFAVLTGESGLMLNVA